MWHVVLCIAIVYHFKVTFHRNLYVNLWLRIYSKIFIKKNLSEVIFHSYISSTMPDEHIFRTLLKNFFDENLVQSLNHINCHIIRQKYFRWCYRWMFGLKICQRTLAWTLKWLVLKLDVLWSRKLYWVWFWFECINHCWVLIPR